MECEKGKRCLEPDSPPPSSPLSSQLSIRTKPLTTTELPEFPHYIALLKDEHTLQVHRSFPVAFQGLLDGQASQFAAVLEEVTSTSERTAAAFEKQIRSLHLQIGSGDQQTRLLTNKMNRTPTSTPDDMIANAMRDTSVQMIQDQMDRLRYDHDRLLYERAMILDDIDTIKTHYSYNLQERDGEISMLRGEVSRLLDKNMKETLLFNDLVEDNEALGCQLDRTKKRVLFLQDAGAETMVAEEPTSATRPLRSASMKEAHLAEQQRLHGELLEAKKETEEAVEECDELLAENKAKYRSLRSAHLKLKRKYEQMTEDIPLRVPAPNIVAATSSEPAGKRRKTRASGSATAVTSTPTTSPPPSKLNIDLKVFTLFADGTVSQHVHMQALEPSELTSEDFSGLKTTAWNFLRTSHTGTSICDGVSIDDTNVVMRVKGFPNGQRETVNEGGLRIWWIAAKGLAAAFEGGLLGEIDMLFTLGEVEGSEWIAGRSMRLADAIGEGNGFMALERGDRPPQAA